MIIAEGSFETEVRGRWQRHVTAAYGADINLVTWDECQRWMRASLPLDDILALGPIRLLKDLSQGSRTMTALVDKVLEI